MLFVISIVGCTSEPVSTTSTFTTTTVTGTTWVAPTTTTPLTTATTTPPATTTPTNTTTTTTDSGVYEIMIYWGMVYVPNTLTVPVGSTVTFILVNGDDPLHPLGFNPRLSLSSTQSGQDTHLTHTFNSPGTYEFYCTEHGDSGSIIVQ